MQSQKINQPFISPTTFSYYSPKDFVKFNIVRVLQIQNLNNFIASSNGKVNLKNLFALGNLKTKKELSWNLPITRTFIGFLMDLYTMPLILDNDKEFQRTFTEGQIDSIAKKHYPDEKYSTYLKYRKLFFKSLLIPIYQTKIKNRTFVSDNLFALRNISNTQHSNIMHDYRKISSIDCNIFTKNILGDTFDTYAIWATYILLKMQTFDSMVYTNKIIEDTFGLNRYDINIALKKIKEMTGIEVSKHSIHKKISLLEAKTIEMDILCHKAFKNNNKITIGFEFSDCSNVVSTLESMLPTIFNIKSESAFLSLREKIIKSNIFVDYETPSNQEEVVFGKNYTSLSDEKCKSLSFVLARAAERCQDAQMVKDVKFSFAKGFYSTLVKTYGFKIRNLTLSTALSYMNVTTLGSFESKYLDELSLHY